MFIGVFALVVVMAVMNGFERELRERVLAVVPHGQITAEVGIRDWPQLGQDLQRNTPVEAVAPYVGGKALISNGWQNRGIELRGIAPEAEKTVSSVSEKLIAGRYLHQASGHWEILIGDILARQLRLTVGDELRLILPKVTVTPLGVYPRERSFVIAGIFSAGAKLDATTAFIQLGDAQKLYQTGTAVHGLRLSFADVHQAEFARPQVESQLGQLPAQPRYASWADTQGSLFQAVQMEKLMVRVLLLFVVLIAAFNIISVLSLAVSDKRGDIAVLRNMGASRATVLMIFLVQGMAASVIGVALAVALGVPAAIHAGAIIAAIEQALGIYVFNPQVYFISRIPSELHTNDVLWVSVFALALSALASFYPAWKAAQTSPAEALRYE